MFVYFRIKRETKFKTPSNWFEHFEVYEFFNKDIGFGGRFAVVYDGDRDDRVLERVALYFDDWNKTGTRLRQPVVFAEREGSLWVGVKYLSTPNKYFEDLLTEGVLDTDVWAVYPFDACGDWSDASDIESLRSEIIKSMSMIEPRGER